MKKLLIGMFIVGLFGVFGEVYGVNSSGIQSSSQNKMITPIDEVEMGIAIAKEKAQTAADQTSKISKQADEHATVMEQRAQKLQTKAGADSRYQAKAEAAKKKAEKARDAANGASDTAAVAAAANKKAQAATTVADAENAAKIAQQANTINKEVTKDRSLWILELDMIELIDKSATFNVSGNLNLGKEGDLTINAEDDQTNILYKALDLMIKVMGTLAVLLYVVGGFFYITSQGDENQVQKGKTIITYTSLGLAIAFASYLLVYLVMSATFTLS